jgi:hypothetical protein
VRKIELVNGKRIYTGANSNFIAFGNEIVSIAAGTKSGYQGFVTKGGTSPYTPTTYSEVRKYITLSRENPALFLYPSAEYRLVDFR